MDRLQAAPLAVEPRVVELTLSWCAQIHAHCVARVAGVFWLDGCEPETRPAHVQNLRFHAGPAAVIANDHLLDHAVHDGMRSVARTRPPCSAGHLGITAESFRGGEALHVGAPPDWSPESVREAGHLDFSSFLAERE